MSADILSSPIHCANLPRFVAEVSSNHNRDLERCLAFIDVAADIGCAAVKFQLFRINELFAPEILSRSAEHQRRKAWELPTDFLPAIAARCRQRGIEFACTPFYLRAVEELLPFVDFYKIASYELLWTDLLTSCARTGKPVVLSTGMTTMGEIESSVNVLIESGCTNLTLLHCVSGYPTPVNKCNLGAIATLSEAICHQLSAHSAPSPCFSVGWSDHSVNPGVIYRAIHHWGASMIEFHLDLDGSGEEYQTGHCWLPEQIQSVIDNVNKGFGADGNGRKEPAACEVPDRDWRADPTDGLRPLLKIRDNWRQ